MSLMTQRASDSLALNFIFSILRCSSCFKSFLLVVTQDFFRVFNLSFFSFKPCHHFIQVNNSFLKFCTSSFNTIEFDSTFSNFPFNCLICCFNFMAFTVSPGVCSDEELLFKAHPNLIYLLFGRIDD